MSERREITVSRLRDLALRGAGVEEVLEHIVSGLGPELSPLTLMAVLMEAFGIPLEVLRDGVEGWERIDREECDIPTEVVVGVLAPYVSRFREQLL